MGGQRPLQFAATRIQFTDFFFRVVLKGHRKMVADKAAERLMEALGFLHIKRQGRKALGQAFALGVQRFNAAFTRGAAKQRQRREA